MDISDWQQRGRDIFDVGRGSGRSLPVPGGGTLKVIGLIVLALVLVSSLYYQVNADEVGVVTRFGRYVRTTDPGAHLKLPFMESVTRVPVQRQLKAEFGFRTASAGVRSEFTQDDRSLQEALMLTGDLNVAVVEWIVQYKVGDPYKYLFKVRNLDDSGRRERRESTTFRDMTEAVMRSVVGDRSVNEILTVGREEIEVAARTLLQQLCDRYETGLIIQQVVLQDVNPPDPVKPAFNEVNQAIQEKERLINDAYAEYNQAIPRARGEAQQAVQAAEGYAVHRVNTAQGDISRFISVYDEYKKAPEVTRKRLYLEMLTEVLPKAGQKIIIDERARGLLPLLNLGNLGADAKEVKP